jgi:hypothetical protein
MVKKKNDKWRMCTDFTDLNKCCPKDDFSLSRIDKVVDSTVLGIKIVQEELESGIWNYLNMW